MGRAYDLLGGGTAGAVVALGAWGARPLPSCCGEEARWARGRGSRTIRAVVTHRTLKPGKERENHGIKTIIITIFKAYEEC